MKLLQILNEIEVPNLMSYKIKVGGKILLVAFKDEGEMDWGEAFEACEKLGDGWRLPTIEELEEMYKQLHKQGKGNFKDDYYWSSLYDSAGDALLMDFSNGNVEPVEYTDFYSPVRAVRSPDLTI